MASLHPGTVLGGTEIEIVGTDDTGMNTIQTIYFISCVFCKRRNDVCRKGSDWQTVLQPQGGQNRRGDI